MTALSVSVEDARARGLAFRQALPQNERQKRSLKAISHMPKIKVGLKVAFYRALPAELDPSGLEALWKARGASLFFPRVQGDALEYAAQPSDSAWARGPLGTFEPPASLPAIDPLMLDLVLVPGVAFGQAGERVGYGKGYYDRFLARLPRLFRVALCFDFQVFERIKTRAWDEGVDFLLTDERQFRIGPRDFSSIFIGNSQ